MRGVYAVVIAMYVHMVIDAIELLVVEPDQVLRILMRREETSGFRCLQAEFLPSAWSVAQIIKNDGAILAPRLQPGH